MPAAARHRLSRDLIIEAGLDIVDRDGVDAVSFRRLAAALGVTPMALYRHFDDKEALLADMLDQFIRRARVLPAEDLPWDDWIRHVAEAMHQALMREPSWIPHLAKIPLKSGGLTVLDAAMLTFRNAGLTHEAAAAAFFGMIQVVLGGTILQVQVRGPRTAPHETIESDASSAEATAPGGQQIGGHRAIGIELLIAGLHHYAGR